jgi:hypothetical protein
MFQTLSSKAEALKAGLLEFMAARVYPNEIELLSEARGAGNVGAKARSRPR